MRVALPEALVAIKLFLRTTLLGSNSRSNSRPNPKGTWAPADADGPYALAPCLFLALSDLLLAHRNTAVLYFRETPVL